MPPDAEPPALTPAAPAAALRHVRARADRSMAAVLVVQWLAVLGVLLAVVPHGQGTPEQLRAQVGATLLLATLITTPALLLAVGLPGEPATRHSVGVAQMLMSTLLFQAAHGRVEAWFHALCSLALLALYLDPAVLASASVVLVAGSLIRGGGFAARTAEPLAWVGLFDALLVVGIRRRAAEVAESAAQVARAEEQRIAAEAEREQAEASEARFRQFADNVGHALWLMDPRRQQAVYVNPAYETTWHRPRDEMYRDPLAYLAAVHPDDRPIVTAALPRQAAGEATVVEVRLAATRESAGRQRWVRLSATPVFDADGTAVRIACVAEDITDRKSAEAELDRAYARERRIAATLQRALLLHLPPRRFPGVTVGAFHRPARPDEAQVGGDFYDAFPLDDGRRVAFAVGDVAGKGLDAAARIAQAKFALRAFLRDEPHAVGAALGRLNRALCGGQTEGVRAGSGFVALALAVLDTDTGSLTLCAAGAELPLILRGATGTVSVCDVGGMPLGLSPSEEYEETATSLAPRDTLLLYTDGLGEARGPGAEILGTDGVANLLGRAVTPPSRDLGQAGRALLDAALAYAAGRPRDDMCFLLVRRDGRQEGDGGVVY
jgi:PAS domain S-box-containing protein